MTIWLIHATDSLVSEQVSAVVGLESNHVEWQVVQLQTLEPRVHEPRQQCGLLCNHTDK